LLVATRRKNPVLGSIRTLFNVGAIGDMSDGQLLERFARGGEAAELAFAALVERHGAVVFETCLTILRDEHEAEEAFQATFLVLVRKSRSLWVRESLSPWLHQVACRAARCARSAAVRRMAHERRAAEVNAERHGRGTPGLADDPAAELRGTLHEEIERLPERYRAAVVLCDLEGRTQEQAARQLACPVGTVKSRLARGRERLRECLRRRGFSASVASLAPGLDPRTAPAVPPAAWADATIRTAVQLAAGRPLGAAVAPQVLALIKDVSRGLCMKSMKTTMLAVLTLGSLAAGVAGFAWGGLREPADERESPPPVQAARPAELVEELPTAERARDVDNAPDIRGDWEVLYVTGTVAGKRVGYTMPGRVVRALDKTIVLPALTGNPDDPLHFPGQFSYRLQPCPTEQVESAQQRLQAARTIWSNVEQTGRKRVLPEFTVNYAKTKLDQAAIALRNAENRRAEAKAAGTSDESEIDMQARTGATGPRLGIYRFKDDMLTICYAGPDRGRPETFAADQPSENLIVLRRWTRVSLVAAVPSRVSEVVPEAKRHGSDLADLDLDVVEERRMVDVDNFGWFRIRIKNTGTKDATNVLARAALSKNIEPIEVRADDGQPVQANWDPARRLMVFPPVGRLGGGKEAVLAIKVSAKLIGLGTCRVFVRQDDQEDTLEEMAAFRITGAR
jgi:RNA polymerase sigma factor (sigma-70 family)